MPDNELVDIKISLKNAHEATVEQCMQEINTMLGAYIRGEYMELNFKDSHHDNH